MNAPTCYTMTPARKGGALVCAGIVGGGYSYLTANANVQRTSPLVRSMAPMGGTHPLG
jgi:hypothetical protein